jgi:N-acetylmuramoyl-L-alanine amidase
MAKNILIVLDPGHYPKYNKGIAPGYYEGDKMYTLSEYEKTALEAYGFDVIITRKKSNDMTLYDRGQVAVKNGKGYDTVVFISNHSNAGVESANGTEVYYSIYRPDSKELATLLANKIESIMDAWTGLTKTGRAQSVKTRKCSNGDYYGVIRSAVNGGNSVVDFAFLIEHGFHTNAKECGFLNNTANLKKLAEAEAKVIADYFGMTKSTGATTSTAKPATKPATSSGEMYRVRKTWADTKSQLGAYKTLSNAKKKADENPGYYVFNSKGAKIYTPTTAKKSNEEIAREVIAGKWGNGSARKTALEKAGYNYSEIQKIVNKLV